MKKLIGLALAGGFLVACAHNSSSMQPLDPQPPPVPAATVMPNDPSQDNVAPPNPDNSPDAQPNPQPIPPPNP